MKIEIVGMGCPKCQATETIVRQVVEDLHLDAQIEKVEDLAQIVERNVLFTPTIIVDDNVKIAGHVPSLEELKKLFDIHE